MKKSLLSILLACLMLLNAFGVRVQAEDLTGKEGMKVTLSGKELKSNFTSSEIASSASGLQPGDSITFTMKLSNENSKAYDWWFKNSVLTSFEDNSIANGGAYDYYLAYTDASGSTTVIYDSTTVGGEDTDGGVGMHEATNALKDYIYLDSIGAGESGTVVLKVALDGETQGNDYQNTLANLMLTYAVEETTTDTDTDEGKDDSTTKKIVKTGDTAEWLPYIIGMLVCGLILLAAAVISLRSYRRKDRK